MTIIICHIIHTRLLIVGWETFHDTRITAIVTMCLSCIITITIIILNARPLLQKQYWIIYEAGMPAGGGKCRYRTTKMLNEDCQCVCVCVCVCM